MRRTMSLDAIIGPYLQGHWPKEPEGPSCVPRQDKSTQVSATGNNAFKCGNYECQKNEWNGIYQWCFLNLELFSFLFFFLCFSVLFLGFFGGGGGIEVRSHHKISLQFLQRNKLLWGWGRVGVGGCPVLAQRLQSENYSRDNSPRSQLTRPFWLHPSSLLRAGTRHCTLVAHILPPSLRLCFSVSPAL